MDFGAPFRVISTGTRHLLDANVTFGQASERYNARDKYRREYSAAERTAAGVATAFGTALPVAAGIGWAQRGMKVPGLTHAVDAVTKAPVQGLSPSAMQAIGRGVGIAALGTAAAIGVKKSIDISKDDGHLGAVGAATGIISGAAAGLAVGTKFAGRYAPLVSGAGAVIGGVAGHLGGARISIGESQIGKEYHQAAQVDEHVGDRAGSFARGAFNHFTEVGPTSQGVSFGHAWGMRETVQTKYSNAERAGAMHGDLAALGILGGGALAITSGLMGNGGANRVANAANVAGHVLEKGALTAGLQKFGTTGTVAAGAAAAGIAGLVAMKEYQRSMDASGGNAAQAALWAGGTLAATAGTAALVARSGMVKGMAAAPKAASSMLVAAALVGVASAAYTPGRQFFNDAKDAIAANGGIDWTKAAPTAGVFGAAGGFGAHRGLSKLVPADGLRLGKVHIPKAAIVWGGAAVTGLAAGGAGVGLSATMPELPKMALSTGMGLAAGAGVGLAFKGVGMKAGMLGGAALGLSASSLLRNDAPSASTPPELPPVSQTVVSAG